MVLEFCSNENINELYKLNKGIYGKDCYPLFVLKQFLDCFGDMLKLVKIEDKHVGFTINGRSKESKTGWILSIGVDKAYRKMGIGSKLLDETINIHRKEKLDCIKLTVHPNNPAINIYRKKGFKIIEHDENYYGDGQERIIMKLNF